jgi:hypothetical protein
MRVVAATEERAGHECRVVELGPVRRLPSPYEARCSCGWLSKRCRTLVGAWQSGTAHVGAAFGSRRQGRAV